MTGATGRDHDAGAPDVGGGALGRLGLSRPQFLLLATLVALVALVGVINYVSYQSIRDQTEDLNYQLQRISGDRVSLERQVMTYALTVERWADGEVDGEEVETQRALVARQQQITADDALLDPAVAPVMERLIAALAATDDLVATGRPPEPGSGPDGELQARLDEMIVSAKSLVDINEGQNFEMVHELEAELQRTSRVEWVLAVLVLAIIVLLVVSIRRMLRSNYRAASTMLRREHERYEAARAEKTRMEDHYREVVDEVSDVVFRCDRHGRWTLLNRAWTTLTGHPVEATLGRPAVESCHPDDQDRILGAMVDLLGGGRNFVSEEIRYQGADGLQRFAVVTARVAHDDDTGEPYVAGTINDVTDRITAERLARAQAEILELVALDVSTHAVLNRIVELIEPHLPGVRLRFVTGDDERDPAALGAVEMSDLSRGGAVGSLEWHGRADPAGTEEIGEIVRLAARLGAIALDRRLAAEQMTHQATHDALTGLPNRSLLVDRIETARARARRGPHPVAVLFLDVDRFKVVNDSLGHTEGDHLLVEVARRLAAAVRPGDTVARFGGDEFVVLVEGLGVDEVRDLADRLLGEVADPVRLGSQVVRSTTSIGIVIDDGTASVEEMLKNADVAMYRAKQAGRGRYEIFDGEMQRWVGVRHATEVALRECVAAGELELWYQPVVRLCDGKLLGFESLVRWNRPGVGVVSPGEFIDIAEEIGVVGEIDAWVLDVAVRQLAAWQRDRPGITVSVNVSGSELARGDFVAAAAEALDRSGADPSGLLLEITESVVLDDADAALARLDELRALGLRFAVDDFGTGYSSLQYLRKLPVDILKIDRTFVSGADAGLADRTIVGSVTELGHALRLGVVAEGIETPEQLAALRAAGVDAGQGYLLGRPTPTPTLDDLPDLGELSGVCGAAGPAALAAR